MKRTTTLLLAALLLTACAETQPEAVAVYPEVQTITLTDTSDETKQYTATPGVELLLPVGTYRATAERDGTVATTCPLGTVYNEPCFGIAQTVEVTRQTHDITLAVTHGAWTAGTIAN